jgi:2-dehydropantoate 2-reductase
MLGVKLALTGQEVTLIARGAHLKAISEHGLTLVMNDGTKHVATDVKATDNIEQAGLQDIVILAVKAHQIAPIAHQLPALFEPDTVVVTPQNGIPWWYFQRHGGEYEGKRIAAVDPDGAITANIEPERIIGCIAYPAAEIAEPGVIRHIEGIRYPIGELDGAETDRAKKISERFIEAGCKAPILPDRRSEIWIKAWGNLTFNPGGYLSVSIDPPFGRDDDDRGADDRQ